MGVYSTDNFTYKEFPANTNNFKLHHPKTLGIIRVLSGETRWQIGQETLHAKEGDLIFMHNLEFHQRIWVSPDLQLASFAFPALLLNSVGSAECLRVFYSRGNAYTHRLFAPPLLSLHQAIRAEIMRSDPSRDMLLGYTLQILTEASREYDRIPNALTHNHSDMTIFNRITASVAYIHEHLTEPLSVSELAKHAHISEGHYTRMFSKYVMTTPADYIARCRVSLFESKRILSNTILDTAFACGFTSASGFYKTYNRITGHPPTK